MPIETNNWATGTSWERVPFWVIKPVWHDMLKARKMLIFLVH